MLVLKRGQDPIDELVGLGGGGSRYVLRTKVLVYAPCTLYLGHGTTKDACAAAREMLSVATTRS